MLFNSLTFVVFFLVVYGAYRLLPGWGMRKNLLLASSYVFYAAWNPPFALLLLLSTVVDWWLAGRMGAETHAGRRKLWLIISLVTNLGLLSFFKYGDFLMENTKILLAAIGIDYHPPDLGILLPVGISFYTFHTLSYTIDVYRGQLKPEASLRDFALFVSFFPQLVAGPIIRAKDFLYQLQAPPVPVPGRFTWGLFLMTLGLFQKVVIADTLLAPAADTVFGHPFPLAALDAWTGALAFGMQVFFDFSGYTLTAIGADLCFGFYLLNNFHFPYGAVGFSDFWRRWHISLSSWLRDYLYVPLGGNRFGTLRTLFNLMLVMLIGGLWHGAAWTFVVWGALHGLLLIAERGVRSLTEGAAWASRTPAQLAAWLATIAGVTVTWVFFRSQDFGSAMKNVLSMAGFFGAQGDQILATRDLVAVGSVVVVVLILHRALRDSSIEAVVQRLPAWAVAAAWIVMSLSVLLTQGNGNAFIYFQF
ncbi:membrane-bound O-acyltransferase family protein [Planctomycetota bacterium]|nr:membrane-bound O-acyltransferase family protein [Planctomycetota bacterium]